MTPEEQQLSELLAELAERHRVAATDGSWLDARLRRARLRRTLATAGASALAVIAIAGGVAAATQHGPQTAPPGPASSSSTTAPEESPSPARAAFVSAIAVRPDGTGAAVVGPCLAGTGTCRQFLRLTTDSGRTLDPGTERLLPEGPHSPDVRRVTVAGDHTVYVWGGGLAFSDDDGRTWTDRDQLAGQISDMDVSADGRSVWIATTDCPARPGPDGCALAVRSGRPGQDPATFLNLPLPVSRGGGPVAMSRTADGRAAVAVGNPVVSGQMRQGALVYTTTDDGRTWDSVASPCQPVDGERPYSTADVATTSDGAVWVLCTTEPTTGAQGKRVYVAHGGTKPFRLTVALPDLGYAEGIAAASADTAYVSASRGAVTATSDGGRSWRQVTDESDFFGPVQVLPDGSGVAPGQADGAGALWAGGATTPWRSYPVATSTISLPPLPSPGPCERSKLGIAVSQAQGGAGGENALLLDIHNYGPGACEMDGYPALAFLDGHGTPIPFGISHTGNQVITAAPPAPVSVPADGHAYTAFGKYRCDVGDKTLATAVDVTLPGREFPWRVDLRPVGGLPYCGAGDPGSGVAVSPVEPDKLDTARFGAPPCQDADLTVNTTGTQDGVLNTYMQRFAVTSSSENPCRIGGFPALGFRDSNGGDINATVDDGGGPYGFAVQPDAVILPAGGTAEFVLSGSRDPNGNTCPQAAAVVATLPGKASHVVRVDLPMCGNHFYVSPIGTPGTYGNP